MLVTMKVKKAVAEDGTEVTPKETYVARAVRYCHSYELHRREYTEDMISTRHVEHFDCRVEVRGSMDTVVRQAVLAES